MSRGKNANFKRGNRTLAWYLNEKLFDKVDGPQDLPEMKRKNSVDSQSSLNSTSANVPPVVPNEERRKKERRQRNRQRNKNSDEAQKEVEQPVEEPKIAPVQTTDQTLLQQQLAAMANKDRENYWYYDQTSDGFYYEHNGSRGWRKRNPKLHGNPPLSSGPAPIPQKTEEPQEQQQQPPQTVEKKVYVPVPVPVFPTAATSKFFGQQSQSPNAPNIKYYDPSTDGYFYEMASVDGWCRRQPQPQQAPRVQGPNSLLHNFNLGRDLTNQEVEELVLSKVDVNGAPALNLSLAQLLARQMSKTNNVQPQHTADEYPSSSSTVSSTHSDDVTPPPNKIQGKDQPVGSFEEPYEFYWSDSEKTEKGGLEKASSTSSVDVEETGANPLSAYFNTMINLDDGKFRNRPRELKITKPSDLRLPNFNVDRFIADLPLNDHDNFIDNLQSMATPFSMDTPISPFSNHLLTKESPMFTPGVHRESLWEKTANADVERGLRDLEKIWH